MIATCQPLNPMWLRSLGSCEAQRLACYTENGTVWIRPSVVVPLIEGGVEALRNPADPQYAEYHRDVMYVSVVLALSAAGVS